jgi:hypothetical protein
MRRPLVVALCAVLGVWVADGQAEHGMPSYSFMVVDGSVAPTNMRVVLHSRNGVAWSLADLAAMRPTLVAGADRVPLAIVDRFDDMEGHAKPFEANAGYGESLVVFEPERPLEPNTHYTLEVVEPAPTSTSSGHTKALSNWTTAAHADTEPPRWSRTPRISARMHDWTEERLPGIDIHVPDERQPFYLLLEATPIGPGSPKRMILRIPPREQSPNAGEPGTAPEEAGACHYVYVFDHADGVFTDARHADAGRRFSFELTALDLAGNPRAAPGPQLVFSWPNEPIRVCNIVEVGAARIEPPPQPDAGAPPPVHVFAPPRPPPRGSSCACQLVGSRE